MVCENGLSRSNISSKQRVRYRSNSFSTMLKSVRGSLSYFKKDSNLSNKLRTIYIDGCKGCLGALSSVYNLQ